jgi:hypothetical protein
MNASSPIRRLVLAQLILTGAAFTVAIVSVLFSRISLSKASKVVELTLESSMFAVGVALIAAGVVGLLRHRFPVWPTVVALFVPAVLTLAVILLDYGTDLDRLPESIGSSTRDQMLLADWLVLAAVVPATLAGALLLAHATRAVGAKAPPKGSQRLQ